jgi:hypothetical protein
MLSISIKDVEQNMKKIPSLRVQDAEKSGKTVEV